MGGIKDITSYTMSPPHELALGRDTEYRCYRVLMFSGHKIREDDR